jgi:TonB family protein
MRQRISCSRGVYHSAVHQHEGTSGHMLPRARGSRVVVVLVLVLCYAAVFYSMSRIRALPSGADGPAAFGPVVSQIGEHRDGMTSRGFFPTENQSLQPPHDWIFPPIDIWPNPPGWSATLSEFTPVADAQPDPDEVDASSNIPASRRSRLHMVRWLRPAYPAEWALAGVEGSVVLELLIDANGQPLQTIVLRSSGSTQLDDSAVQAASAWRFAAPRWDSKPVEVSARVELRYNLSGGR